MDQTFHLHRSCQHCGTGIPDQAHGLRQFCEPEELEDGSIRDCKSDFHAQRRASEMEDYNQHMLRIRNMDRALSDLIAHKGPLVSVSDLDRAGVQLEGFATIARNPTGRLVFNFLRYSLIHTSATTFKITPYETRK